MKGKLQSVHTVMGAKVLEQAPPGLRVALEALAAARYPLETLEELVRSVPESDEGSVSDVARNVLGSFVSPTELPIRDFESALRMLAGRLPGVLFPIPGLTSRFQSVPSDFNPAGRLDFPDTPCGRAARRYATDAGLGIRDLAEVVMASHACDSSYQELAYGSGTCADLARAAYAQRYIQAWGRSAGPPSPDLVVNLQTRAGKREAVNAEALSWAHLVFVMCEAQWGRLSVPQMLGASAGNTGNSHP